MRNTSNEGLYLLILFSRARICKRLKSSGIVSSSLCCLCARTVSALINSWCVCSACFEGTFSNFISSFSTRISSWRICSVHAPVPDAYAQRMHQFLTRMHQFLTHMLSARNISLCACWWYTNKHLKNGKTDVHDFKRNIARYLIHESEYFK